MRNFISIMIVLTLSACAEMGNWADTLRYGGDETSRAELDNLYNQYKNTEIICYSSNCDTLRSHDNGWLRPESSGSSSYIVIGKGFVKNNIKYLKVSSTESSYDVRFIDGNEIGNKKDNKTWGLKSEILAAEQKQKQAEQKRKEDFAKKVGYPWCSKNIQNNCLLEIAGLQVLQQTNDGTLVEDAISNALLDLFLVGSGVATYSNGGTPKSEILFVVSNAKDKGKVDGEYLDEGIFARIGNYQYDSLSGNKTVKKLKRIQ